MFTTIKRILHYAFIKEAFTDASGSLRLNGSGSTMQDMVSSHPWVRQICQFPIYQDSYDFLPEDDANDFHQFVNMIKPVTLVGKLHRTQGESATVLLENGEIIPVQIPHDALVEKAIAEDSAVYALLGKGEDSSAVKMLVSKPLFDALAEYTDEWGRLYVLEEFLRMDHKSQRTIRQVLCNHDARRSTLRFLSYAVSRSADQCDLSSDEALQIAVDDFKAVTLEDVLCIIDTMDIRDLLLPSCGVGTSPFALLLVVFAIVSGVSPWVYGNKSIALVLADKVPSRYIEDVSRYLPYLVDEEYQKILNDMLSRSKKPLVAMTNVEDFLFESITVWRFDDSFVAAVVDSLFSNAIAMYQIAEIGRLLKGPNEEFIRAYVFRRFFEKLDQEELGYHLIASTILNHEIIAQGRDPWEEAAESAVLPFARDDLLLGICRIGLLVWMQFEKPNPIVSEAALSPNVLCALMDSVIQNDDKLLYSVAASCIHDLYLLGSLPDVFLEHPSLFESAIAALKDEETKYWAERLLSIVPWNESRELPENAPALCDAYLLEMEKSLQKEEGHLDPEVSFGILTNLGYFRGKRLHKVGFFRKLERFYHHGIDSTQEKRLHILQNRLDEENLFYRKFQQIRPLSSQM